MNHDICNVVFHKRRRGGPPGDYVLSKTIAGVHIMQYIHQDQPNQNFGIWLQLKKSTHVFELSHKKIKTLLSNLFLFFSAALLKGKTFFQSRRDDCTTFSISFQPILDVFAHSLCLFFKDQTSCWCSNLWFFNVWGEGWGWKVPWPIITQNGLLDKSCQKIYDFQEAKKGEANKKA